MAALCSYKNDDLQFTHTYDTHPKQQDFILHIHDQYEIYCFLAGDAEYLVEGNVYPLKPGCILIMRPSEVHKVRIISQKPYERYVIQFADSSLNAVDPERYLLKAFLDRPLGQKNRYFSVDFDQMRPKELLDAMCVPVADEKERRLKVLSYLYSLLEQLHTAFLQKDDSFSIQRTSAEKLVSYINEHLSDDLSLHLLSERFFLSASQINRLFKQATGSSVGEYILVKRLMNARSSLRSGQSASEACQKSGFKDYSAFYRSYCKRFGVSPREDMPEK